MPGSVPMGGPPLEGRTIVELAEELLATRDVHMDQWRELRLLLMPEDPDPRGGDQPGQRLEKPVDGVGIRANQVLASGLFSNTITPGQAWFSLRPRGKAQEDESAKDYLAALAKHALEKIQNSNFSLAAHQMLLRYCAYGTGILYSGYDVETRQLWFREYPVSSVGLGESPEGNIDMVAREFMFTARQAADKWGDACASTVLRAANNPKEMLRTTRYAHLVMPRAGGDPAAVDPLRKAFAAYYLDLENRVVVEESGFTSMPYQVGRFYKPFEHSPYGTGPGHNCLPELRTLMASTADWFDNVRMANFPPIFFPDADAINIARQLRPAAVIPWSAGLGEKPFPLQIGGHPELNLEFNQQRRDAIEAAFFVDLFLAVEMQKQMTAYEVQERMAEKIQAISPVVSRKSAEIDAPLVLRVVRLLEEHGDLPGGIPRPELLGAPLEVTFSTQFHQRLNQAAISGFLRGINNVAAMAQAAQMAPDLVPVINIPKAIRAMLRAENADPAIINSDAQERAMRQKINAEAQAMAMAEQANAAASAIKPIDPSKRPEPGSPMDRGGML